MNKILFLGIALAMHASAYADNRWTEEETSESNESGLITGYVNKALQKLEAKAEGDAEEKMTYGRTETRWASVPKFGGYFIGRYSYNDQDGKHDGDGFNQRLIRFYVDGTILKDFKYRIQVQCNNKSFHMKDFYLEWARYKELSVKVGQFKRAFGFENPMNPWDISTGDYSLLTKKFTGHGDYIGGEEAANGGRDQGIQLQGDVLPVGQDKHRLFHYQIGLWNGQGINTSDADSKKDVIGTFQVQPIKNLYVGFFGWKGTYVNTATKDVYHRNRYILGAKYENKGYTLRGEYAHSAPTNGLPSADAWYATAGYPICKWLRMCAQYQCYRQDKTWEGSHSMYSIIPEIQLHKNLKLQLQYNYNNSRTAADRHYNELVAEIYVRL